MEMRNIVLPFDGFYESKWSQIIDYELEKDTEYLASSDSDFQEDVPEYGRLDEKEIAEAQMGAGQQRVAEEAMCKDIVTLWNRFAKERGFVLNMSFLDIDHPKYYNFVTDRLFVEMPLAAVKALYSISRKEKHVRLIAEIKRQFTSYDGFSSFYSNKLVDWLKKGFLNWDHNELSALLSAIVPYDEIDKEVFDEIVNSETHVYGELAVDHKDFLQRVKSAQEEKMLEYVLAHPEEDLPEPPYRCKLTPDLWFFETPQ